jgi:integrase
METLLFEWYKGPRRTLSINLTAVGDLHYAALLGPNKQCGTCLHLFLIFCGEFRPDATERARKTVKLDWVGFHAFRHFRASQWVMHGVDVRTVKELLGHADIQTTMRYAHFAPNHALQSVIEAQRREKTELAAVTEAAGNK